VPRAVGPDAGQFLLAYDRQLRTDAEATSAIARSRLGPLLLLTFEGGRGFVTYSYLDEAHGRQVLSLVEPALDHFFGDPAIQEDEWKSRGHDRAPRLHEELLNHGLTRDEPESIMVGFARLLDVDVPLPPGVVLRRITSEEDVRAMVAMQGAVFGGGNDGMATSLLRRLADQDGMELWVAEFEGAIVSAGRLDPIADSDFASIWGGATREEWRRRGIYRALTAARARSALALGKTLIHSDSTEHSRPILERAGFLRVSTTTPYRWHR